MKFSITTFNPHLTNVLSWTGVCRVLRYQYQESNGLRSRKGLSPLAKVIGDELPIKATESVTYWEITDLHVKYKSSPVSFYFPNPTPLKLPKTTNIYSPVKSPMFTSC